MVKEVGAQVRKLKVGDRAGVGYFVNSCGKCGPCTRALRTTAVRARWCSLLNSLGCFHK
ncbi:alcohol dehydrogenase catalytic domain-containing protein [Helicobacter heilmannii]|uniref:alcohol dehydrogenase catalytic domain-containing protein n=1 Tax=Helicobacter heilmannii TaxID=35817 RepID=UPI0009E8EEBD